MRQSFCTVQMQTSPYLWDTIVDGFSEVHAGVSQGPSASFSVKRGKIERMNEHPLKYCFSFVTFKRHCNDTIALHKEKSLKILIKIYNTIKSYRLKEREKTDVKSTRRYEIYIR